MNHFERKCLAVLSLTLLMAPLVYARRQSSDSSIPVTIDISPGYRYKSDGLGTYYNLTADRTQQSLLDYKGAGLDFFRTNNYTSEPAKRHETITLDKASDGLGAANYVLTSNGVLHHIYTPTSFSKLPVGATMPLSLLFIGDTVAGGVHPQPSASVACGPGLALGGAGTTQPSVTRNSATRWHISLPVGSICRLYWPAKDSEQKTDYGLYYFDADIVINLQ